MNTLLLTVRPYAVPPVIVDGVSIPGNLVDTRATTATYISAGGVMKIAPANTIRGDWSTGAGNMLVETAATNTITGSMTFLPGSGSYIFPYIAIPATATGAPTSAIAPLLAGSTVMAHTRTTDGSGALVPCLVFTIVGPILGGALTTFSAWVYLPAGSTVTGAAMGLASSAGSFVLGTGILGVTPLGTGNAAGGVVSTIALNPALTGQWQRISTTISLNEAFLLTPCLLLAGPPSAGPIYSANWQAEVGTVATSYIPTTNTAATRAADVISYTAESTDAWDLCLDANGNIAMASEPYSLAQDAASAIKTFAGECWYDTTIGVPYWSEVLGQAPPVSLLKTLWNTAALTVPDVASAATYITAISGRQVNGQVQITSTSGQTGAASF